MNNDAYDTQGNTFPGNPNDIGAPVQINQVAQLVSAQQEEASNVQNAYTPVPVREITQLNYI
jgi:hypothetical protein